MKKVLILGSRGMLGHVLASYLQDKEGIEVITASRNAQESDFEIDAANSNALQVLIQHVKPDYIINCIGVLIGDSNKSPEMAIRVNALMPHVLSSIASSIGSRLITVSTDCVFSGSKGGYHPNDPKDAGDPYGQSKSLGELINEKDVTLRTSIIGPELKSDGVGLFDWLMSQTGEVNGFTKAFWSGVTTLELSKIILEFIRDFRPGLYQVAHSPKISKFDLLVLINEKFNKGLTVLPYEVKVIDKSLKHSAELAPVASYSQQLDDLIDYMSSQEVYGKYFRAS